MNYKRRGLLLAIGGLITARSIDRASATTDPDELSNADLKEFEELLTGLFGDEEALPLGLNNAKDERDSETGGFSIGNFDISSISILGGSADSARATSSDASQETVIGLAATIDETFDLVDDMGSLADDVAAVNSDFTRQTFRVQHLLAVLHERDMIATLSPDDIVTVRRQLPEAARYLPLIGSFNNVVQTAGEVEDDDQQSVINFYIAVAAFAIEVIFFKFSVGYNIAFKGTNILATQATFARLLQYTSPKFHALILSEVHWALREGASKVGGKIAGSTVEFVLTTTQQLNQEDLEGQIDGVRTELEVDTEELLNLELFNCDDDQDGRWSFEDIFGGNSHVDPVLERADTVVQGACKD